MRVARRVLSAVALAALVAAASCSSDEGGGTFRGSAADPDASPITEWEEGVAAQGDVAVTWKNLDPRNPSAVRSLVNESSEIGRRLRSGTASSSEIRVIADAEMGRLLAALETVGFFEHATDGMGLGNAPEVSGRRGVVVVTQNGRDRGLMLTPNLGTGPIPTTYTESKKLILAVHSQVQGFDVKANIGAPDEDVFQLPKPTLRRP